LKLTDCLSWLTMANPTFLAIFAGSNLIQRH